MKKLITNFKSFIKFSKEAMELAKPCALATADFYSNMSKIK